MEKSNVVKCQEMLQDGKKLLLKQQKLIRSADREEDAWELIKCYVSDDLASDSGDEKKQLLIRKNERVLSKKIERRSYRMPLFIKENPSNTA